MMQTTLKHLRTRIIALILVLSLVPVYTAPANAAGFAGNEAMSSGDANVIEAVMLNLMDYTGLLENDSTDILGVSDPVLLMLDKDVESQLSNIPGEGKLWAEVYDKTKLLMVASWELGQAISLVSGARKDLLTKSLNQAADHQELMLKSIYIAYLSGKSDYANGLEKTSSQVNTAYGHQVKKGETADLLRENASRAIFWFHPSDRNAINKAADHMDTLENILPSAWQAYKSGYAVAEALDSSDRNVYIEMTNTPKGTLNKGASFWCKGVIRSEKVLTSVSVRILNSSGKIIQSNTITPNKTSVDIFADGLDTLKFSQLSEGSYLFELEATNKAEITEKFESFFSIAAAGSSDGSASDSNNSGSSGSDGNAPDGSVLQYRYHRYIDSAGNVSLCPYYGGWKYNSVMHIEYSDWMNAPLPVDNGQYASYSHQQQGSSCTNAGCIDITESTNRHRDTSGEYWFYQETRSVAVHVHTEDVTPAVAPTCTAEGKTVGRYCLSCGEVLVSQEILPAVGHLWGDAALTMPATCTTAGILSQTCGYCFEVKTETIPAFGHTMGEWTVSLSPTAGIEGTEMRICQNCNYTEHRKIPALPENDTHLDQSTISVGTASALPGEMVTVPVSIQKNSGFAGFAFKINYDSDALSLIKIERGDLLKGDESGSFLTNVQTGEVTWFAPANITETGTLLVLQFMVSEDFYQNCDVSVSLKDNEPANFVDLDVTAKHVDFISGEVYKSSDLVLGDLNGDNIVSAADTVLLAKHLVGLIHLTSTQEITADVNSDDIVTAADAVLIAKYLVGLIEHFNLRNTQPAVMTYSLRSGPVISMQFVSAKSGDTVQIPVTIGGNPGFAGFTLSVDYDAAALALTDISKGSLLKDSESGSFTKNVERGEINWTDAYNLSGDGELFVLTFKVLSDSGDHTVALDLKGGYASNFVNENVESISVKFSGGTICVESPHKPDLPDEPDLPGENAGAEVSINVPVGAEVHIDGGVYTSADGKMTIGDVAEGTYDLQVKKAGCLTHTVKEITVGSGDIDLGEIVLLRGDVSSDEKINMQDLRVFLQNFNKTGENITEPLTDVTEDEKVNMQDLRVFLKNFNKTAEKDCTFIYGA